MNSVESDSSIKLTWHHLLTEIALHAIDNDDQKFARTWLRTSTQNISLELIIKKYSIVFHAEVSFFSNTWVQQPMVEKNSYYSCSFFSLLFNKKPPKQVNNSTRDVQKKVKVVSRNFFFILCLWICVALRRQLNLTSTHISSVQRAATTSEKHTKKTFLDWWWWLWRMDKWNIHSGRQINCKEKIAKRKSHGKYLFF